MIYTLGNPSSVYAVTGRYKPNNTTAPDAVAAIITFEGGDKAVFTHSYSLPGFGWGEIGLRRNWMQVDIVGPKGFMQFPAEDLSEVLTVFRSRPEGKEELMRCVWQSEWGANGYREELEHFVQCVREGTPSRVPGVEGRRVILLLEGLLHSAETGQVCRFNAGRPVFGQESGAIVDHTKL